MAAIWHFMKTGNIKLWRFAFNHKNFYILCSPFIIAAIIQSVIERSYIPIIIFLSFGLAGMAGETLFSWWWKLIFEKRFWVYRVDTLVDGYTSLLNFIPWGMGGILYLLIIDKFAPKLPKFDLGIKLGSLEIFFGGVAISLLIAYLLRKRRKFGFELKVFNLWTYTLFCLPIIMLVAYLTCVNIYFLWLAFGFGIGVFVSEYLFGKVSEILISKKLWYYNYLTFDHEHSTPLNIIPFMLAGFYFWAVWLVIERMLGY